MDNPPFIDDLLYPLRPSFTGHVQSPRLVVPRYCRYVVGWLSLSKPLVSGVWPKQDLNDLNVATLYFLISSSSGPDLQESKNHKNPDLVFSLFFQTCLLNSLLIFYIQPGLGWSPIPNGWLFSTSGASSQANQGMPFLDHCHVTSPNGPRFQLL